MPIPKPLQGYGDLSRLVAAIERVKREYPTLPVAAEFLDKYAPGTDWQDDGVPGLMRHCGYAWGRARRTEEVDLAELLASGKRLHADIYMDPEHPGIPQGFIYAALDLRAGQGFEYAVEPRHFVLSSDAPRQLRERMERLEGVEITRYRLGSSLLAGIRDLD